MTGIILKVASIFTPPVLQLWQLLIDTWPSDPQRIRFVIYRSGRKKIRKLVEQIDEIKTETRTKGNDTVGDREAKPRETLIDNGNWHEFWARVHWGHGSERRAFKSAWNYVLAGECFFHAETWELAARMYHWAAHQFRELGSLGRAREYYCEAAESFLKHDNTGDARRSVNRAIAVCVMAGDDDGREGVRTQFHELLSSS